MEKDETEYLMKGENGKRLKESINQLKKSQVNSITNQNKMTTKHIILITLAFIYIAAAIVLRVKDNGKF